MIFSIKTIPSFIVGIAAMLLTLVPGLAAHDIYVLNTTPYVAKGNVGYETLLCKDDEYTITSSPYYPDLERGKSWSNGTGFCDITKVSARVLVKDAWVTCTPYTNYILWNTAYPNFIIIYHDEDWWVKNKCEVKINSSPGRRELFSGNENAANGGPESALELDDNSIKGLRGAISNSASHTNDKL